MEERPFLAKLSICSSQRGKGKKLKPTQVAELQRRREQGVLIKTLMNEYGISKASVYRYLNGAKGNGQLVEAQQDSLPSSGKE